MYFSGKTYRYPLHGTTGTFFLNWKYHFIGLCRCGCYYFARLSCDFSCNMLNTRNENCLYAEWRCTDFVPLGSVQICTLLQWKC